MSLPWPDEPPRKTIECQGRANSWILVTHSIICSYCRLTGSHSPVHYHFPDRNRPDYPSHCRVAEPHWTAVHSQRGCSASRPPPMRRHLTLPF